MHRILILQHLDTDGPAYLGTWLRHRGVPFDVRNTEAGDAFPASIDGYDALAVLGGAMSANDPLPSLRQAESLILQGIARGIPVLGLCLGGQLMARALGATVQASPEPEIGWQAVDVLPTPAAHRWFGDVDAAVVMQWHYEAFTLPAGAELLASSAACPNQAFAFGPHLALQFHVEADAGKITFWSTEEGDAWRQALQSHPRTVQDGEAIRAATPIRVPVQHALADRLFSRWLGNAADSLVSTM
jgi:GMP synthase (glutamine-hydrolysing)